DEIPEAGISTEKSFIQSKLLKIQEYAAGINSALERLLSDGKRAQGMDQLHEPYDTPYSQSDRSHLSSSGPDQGSDFLFGGSPT
ncbi:hypothetical protein STEG23_006693, partial [Scotinomys teguina]